MNSGPLSDAIIVGDSNSLNTAIERLAKGSGGLILLKSSKDAYRVEISDPGDRRTDAPVEIRSLDPDEPAVIEHFMATNREGLTITDVVMRQTGDRDEHYARSNFLLHMRGCEDVAITDVTFEGWADGPLGIPGSDAPRAINLATFQDSRGVRLEDSTVFGFHHGVALVNARDVTIAGNDVSGLTGDGVRIGGAQDVRVEANVFHDFFGSTPGVNHPDMIQFWGANIRQNTERVAIVDNVFHTGEGPSYQMIFGNNEHRAKNGWLFEDITVEHNVLFGSNNHMISLGDTRNLKVRNNTVMINDDTMTLVDGGTWRDPFEGFVEVRSSKGQVVARNIAEAFRDPADALDNTVLTRSSVEPGGNVRDHVTNWSAQGSGDLRDLTLRPDSPLNGVHGSRLTWFSEEVDALLAVARVERSWDDLSRVVFDAGLTRDADGLVGAGEASFTWTFDDGTVKTGRRVSHDFGEGGRRGYTLEVAHADGSRDAIERDIEIGHATLLDLRTASGRVWDASPHATPLTVDGDVRLTERGIWLGGTESNGTYVEIPRDESHVQGRRAFDIGLTLDPAKGSSGTFLEIGRVFEAGVTRTGAVSVKLRTLDTGDAFASATTKGGVFGDGEPHRLNIVYDRERLALYVDGEVAAETALTGRVVDGGWYGFRIGNFWGGAGFRGEVSDFMMKGEPSSPAEVLAAHRALVGSGASAPQPEPRPDSTPAPSPSGPLETVRDVLSFTASDVVVEGGRGRVAFDAAALLANDRGHDGRVALLRDAIDGAVEVRDGGRELVYHFDVAGFDGKDAFTYRAFGTGGASDHARAYLEVDLSKSKPAPTALALVDAGADRVLFDLGAITVLEAQSVRGLDLSMVARAVAPDVASVRMLLNGAVQGIENIAPYALFGDRRGDYGGGLALDAGDRAEVTAEFFAGRGASGRALGETQAELSVQNQVLEGRALAADVFAFDETRMGRDAVRGFEDLDRLAFFGPRELEAADVLALARVLDGDTVIDFGGGDTLTLKDFAQLDAHHIL